MAHLLSVFDEGTFEESEPFLLLSLWSDSVILNVYILVFDTSHPILSSAVLQSPHTQDAFVPVSPLVAKVNYGPTAQGATNHLKARHSSSSSASSSFAGASRLSTKLEASADSAGIGGGVGGLKAIALAETTDVLTGDPKRDRMGEYIASRGGSLPIRKVLNVDLVHDLRRCIIENEVFLYMKYVVHHTREALRTVSLLYIRFRERT